MPMSSLVRRLLVRAGRAFNENLASELREHYKRQMAQVKEIENRVSKQIRDMAAKAERVTAKQQRTIERLRTDITRQHTEMRLMLTRPSAQGNGRADGGIPIALSAVELPPIAGQSADEVSIPKDSIVDLARCPVCGTPECTPVSEFNKLLLLESGVDDDARVYKYALCHGCGVVHARRRPVGPRYRYILDRFEITLGRAHDGVPIPASAVLGSTALDDDERRALHKRVSRGIFVSEHLGLNRREYLPALLQDRMANSVHIELLGSLVPLSRPRVLELRPRLGSIGAALKRLYEADVYDMPLFDGQQFLIEEAYGIPATHKVDYDTFAIPYEGQFDLVVANHMFTHAVRPRAFFDTVRERLNPGGYVYLYNEPDERDFLENGKSMFNSLNAFHLQTFNAPSLARSLEAAGFETVFVTHHLGNLIALGRKAAEPRGWARMSDDERERRIKAYQKARDIAILRLPDRLRGHFADEWDALVERAVAAGLADFDDRGRLRLVKFDREDAD
jgi:methyltransferase family protein